MNKNRMPAEWEKQEAIILSWPHNLETWTPEQLAVVERTYCCMISEISEYQDVWLNVRSEIEQARVKKLLQDGDYEPAHLKFFLNPAHDVWVRDYGPIYIYQGHKRLITKWQFNGWGAKYEDEYFNDNAIPYKIAELTNTEVLSVEHILEGGSIDVNGKGTLLTSTDCLLNQNRHDNVSQAAIEAKLHDYLGVTKVIWATGQIKGDDTDGHIDDAARFVSPTDILCISEDNVADENYEGICALQQSLTAATDQDSHPLRITSLPMPDPVYFQDKRLPASYANFLITNKKILVPIYNCEKDSDALRIIGQFFPERQTIGIDCTELVAGFGSIHCVSMQVPAKC